MAAVQYEIWVVSLILFYAFYLSLAYHGFLECFRGSFTHFICLLPIDRVSQRLSCQLYTLYPSLACTEFSVTFQRLSHSPCALSCVSLHCQTVLYASKGKHSRICTLPVSYIADTPWSGCYPSRRLTVMRMLRQNTRAPSPRRLRDRLHARSTLTKVGFLACLHAIIYRT